MGRKEELARNIPAVQVINKILYNRDISIVHDNNLSSEMFSGYESEFNYLLDFYNTYNEVLDIETFADRFPNFEIFEVSDPESSIVKRLVNQYKMLSIRNLISSSADMSKTLSDEPDEVLEYMTQELNEINLDLGTEMPKDLFSDGANERYKRTDDVGKQIDSFYIPTGFAEIDKDINGLQQGNELAVIYARTNNGKSWVAETFATNIALMGYNVGYFSPEMSAVDLGYRFDSIYGHFSNNAIRLGKLSDEQMAKYKEHIDRLSKLNSHFYVFTPKSFSKRRVTVSKLKYMIIKLGLKALFIDGIKYMTDERYRRGDSTATSLTNISEDLMELSAETGIPIVVVVQANRGGVVDKNSLDTPELENIKDSDGIAQNASLVWAIRKITRNDETFLLIDNKKARNGENCQSYKYRWKVDTGEYEFVSPENIPSETDNDSYTERAPREVTGGQRNRRRRKLEDEM